MVLVRLLIHSLFTVQFTKLCEWFSMYSPALGLSHFPGTFLSLSHILCMSSVESYVVECVCFCVYMWIGCMRDIENNEMPLSREVEWTSASIYLLPSCMIFRKRYSNFRPSVHISKLFTCGCTNLIKSFTWA